MIISTLSTFHKIHRSQSRLLNLKMSSSSIFPEEIIINILSRLPAKSIGICRCVCKPWRSLLSQPHFIKTHLKCITKLQDRSLILVSDAGSLYSITFSNAHHLFDEMPEPAKKLSFADHPDTWARITASCDGLVLVSDKKGNTFLINSVTRQIREVPPSPFALDPRLLFMMYGFGYDSVNDDYKIVTLIVAQIFSIAYLLDDEDEPDRTETIVYVYSIKNGTNWKKVESSPYCNVAGPVTSGVFVNGCIHWLAYETTPISSVIAAFDLAQEKFYEFPLPISIGESGFDSLVELGGCLCLCRTTYGSGTDVWVMKEHGNKESWTKFTTTKTKGLYIRPLCMLGEEQMVVMKEEETSNEKLVKYGLLNGSFNDIVVDGISVEFPRVGIFVESLVSPYGSHETS